MKKIMLRMWIAVGLISMFGTGAFGQLAVSIDSVTGVTASASYVQLNLTGTNGTGLATSMTLFWGRSDGQTNAADWSYSNTVSTTSLGVVSFHLTNLVSGFKYYAGGAASESNSTVWVVPSTNWITSAGYPTSSVPLGYHTVLVDSNGVIVAPLNFGVANGFNTTNDVSDLMAYTNYANSKFSTNDANISNLNATVSGLTNSVSNVVDRVTVLEAAGDSRYFARTNASDTIEVFATGTGITVSRTNSTYYWSIPVGKHVHSFNQRVDGSYTDGGVIYHAFGTTDINNASAILAWNPRVNCYREDSLAPVTLTVRPYVSNPTWIKFTGMDSTAGIMYHISGGL